MMENKVEKIISETIQFGNDSIPKDQIIEYISNIEKAMESGMAIDIPIEHRFSEGVYAREMTVPKGVMLVGRVHKFRNLNILSKGEVSVLSIDGIMRVKAPFTFVASPGSKRLFYMHEDTVWTTILGTSETNVEKIESEFTVKNYSDYLSYEKSNVINMEDKPCLL